MCISGILDNHRDWQAFLAWWICQGLPKILPQYPVKNSISGEIRRQIRQIKASINCII